MTYTRKQNSVTVKPRDMQNIVASEGWMIRGGDGSHWAGCEETHFDCAEKTMKKYLDVYDDGQSPLWEPINKLEMAPIDSEGEIVEKHNPQYVCFVIGHCLSDPEACYSLIEICTGLGWNNDETLAKLILDSLQFKVQVENERRNQTKMEF